MIGSTIIKVDDVESLKQMKIDDIIGSNKFKKVDLDSMITLDFEMIVGESNHKWSNGQPAVFNEEEGIIVMPLDKDGIEFVIKQIENQDDEIKKSDLQKLSEFVEIVGPNDLYEIATF